jgi:hypothetical protein
MPAGAVLHWLPEVSVLVQFTPGGLMHFLGIGVQRRQLIFSPSVAGRKPEFIGMTRVDLSPWSGSARLRGR